MTEQDIRKHLLFRYDGWMTAVAKKDLDTIASIYASDAVYHAQKQTFASFLRSAAPALSMRCVLCQQPSHCSQ